MEKNINISLNSKILVATALGAGVLVGASTAYILTRISERSHLTHLVSHLDSNIQEVKDEIAYIESELGLSNRVQTNNENKSTRKRRKKCVSFCSTTTSDTYKTALNSSVSSSSYKTALDNTADDESWATSSAFEGDYFSPDEDAEDEFFDVVSADSEGSDTDNDFAKDVSSLSRILRTVDSLIEKSSEDQIQAYNLLQEKKHQYEHNAEVLWRMAKAARNMAVIEEINGNLDTKKDYIIEAFAYAERALSINDASADVHKWYAILSGARGEFLHTRDRIGSGHIFKKHIDIALRISPNDATLHHLLGRFCYEVSLMSWVERKVAAAIFGEIPSATFKEAMGHFLAAEELRSPAGWKENRYYIAKCYLKQHDPERAKLWLSHTKQIHSITTDDELIDRNVSELMQKHSIVL